MAPFPRTTLPAHLNPQLNAGRTGRPSEYRPEYCQMVIEDMRAGYSVTAFAGKIGVARDTIYEWIKCHPDFSDAVNRADPGRQRAWERKLIHAEKGGEVASAIFGLKNVAPQDWKEVREVKHDHTHALHRLTDAQLYEIAARSAGNGEIIEGEATRVETD